MNTPLTTAEIVERLRPSAKVDEEVDGAIRALRANGLVMLAGSLNEWLVDNNARKSEAAAALLALEGERDEAHRHAKALTKALVGLTPGGSEYFTRSTLLDDYVADIETCTAVIRERFDSGHKAKLERVDERRRAEAAEAELAKVRTATVETLSMCERYADFIRTSVKADDIEMHPYLPELESIIERAKLASPAEPAAHSLQTLAPASDAVKPGDET